MLNTIKTEFKQIVHNNLRTYRLADLNDVRTSNIIETQLVEELQQCVIDNMAKSRKGKKPKKPVGLFSPKKPKTAYQAFCQNNRDEIIQALQADSGDNKISMIDVNRELGARWKKLQVENPEEYQVYIKTAKEEKAQYIKNLEEYEDSDDYKAFIESDEYKVWEAWNNAAKEAKEKAKKAIPYVHKVKTEDQIKSAYALFQNEYMQEFVHEYQEEIGIPAAKKAFSDLWKVHYKKDNRGNPITDDNKFSIDKTAQDYIDEYEPIKAARSQQ